MDVFKSSNGSLLAIVSIVLAFAFMQRIYRITSSILSRVPGPWYSRWTSLVLDFNTLRARRALYVHSLHETYGSIVRIGPNEVSFTDLEAIKTIYNVQETFPRSQFYRRLGSPDTENMFSTINVDFHRRHRKLLGGPLSESSLKIYIPQTRALSELAVQRIAEEMKRRGCADVYKWWLFMAADVVGELTFGESSRMLQSGVKNGYTDELLRFSLMGALRVIFPSLVGLAYKLPFQLPILGDAVHATNNTSRYAVEALDRHQRLVQQSTHVQHTLFTKVFQAEEEEKLSFNEVRCEAESYIIAGTDSTAYTLTYIIWAVCRHPPIRDALVKELLLLPEGFTDAHLRGVSYLSQIIDEALRLYSITPTGLPRDIPRGGYELAGYWFEEGTTVSTQAYTMHRDPFIFPQPNDFIPSRWENPTKAMRDSYMPWGRGSRICIGQNLAMMELRLGTALFFLKFPNAQVSTLEGMSDKDMEPKVYFDATPAGARCLIQSA